MTSPVTWDAWPEPHKKFATALSLAVPAVAVAMKNVVELARGVVMAADGRTMAMDAEGEDPLGEVEKALDKCSSFLKQNIQDEVVRAKGLELVKALMRAASAAGGAGKGVHGAEDARRSRDGAAGRDRRQAADARPSQLDKLLRGVRNPSAGGLTGR